MSGGPGRGEALRELRGRLRDRLAHGVAALHPRGGRLAPYPRGVVVDSELVICGFDEACAQAAGFEAVISIESPDATPTTGRLARFRAAHEPAHKVLRFHDVEDAHQASPPMRHHVRAGLAFARRHAGRRLLIHCYAGISRSTALAFAILVHRHNAIGSEYGMLERLLALRPQASPNRLVVRHADALLGCNGRLLRAVEESATILETRRRNFSPPPVVSQF